MTEPTAALRPGAGTLYAVATPIGNLGDLGPNAREILGRAGLIVCEDTRRTGRLLHHAGIAGARLAICNEHTETSRIAEVLDALGTGDDVALVTDAGTPGISDPGARMVAAVLDAGYRVAPIAGPSAVTAALSVSGMTGDRFVVEGFLPRRGADRTRRLTEIADETRTVVVYEAPHRFERTIADLTEVCGPERRVVIARELTKMHEEIIRTRLGAVDTSTPRGEYVIVIEGVTEVRTADDDEIRDALRRARADGLSTRDAAGRVADALQVSRRRAYSLAIGLEPTREHRAAREV